MIEVRVENPQTVGDGVSQHVVYSLATQTDLPSFPNGNATVTRRFSDFIWLRGQLVLGLSTVIVPALPDKVVVGRFTPELIAARMRALQRFIRRCAAVPRICSHVVFVSFLALAPAEFAAFRSRRDAATAKPVGAVLADSFSAFAAMVTGSAVAQRTDADLSVGALESYVSSLEPALGALIAAAGALQGAEMAAAQALGEFGGAYGMLGAAERRALGASLQAVGQVARQSGGLLGDSASRASHWLREDLADTLRMVKATAGVFATRRAAREAHATALQRLEAAKADLSRAGGATAGEAGAAAGAAVEAAQGAVDAADTELHRITLDLVDAVEAFRAGNTADLLGHWTRFAVAQARRAAVEAELWAGIEGVTKEGAVAEASSAPHLGVPDVGQGAAVAAAAAAGGADADFSEGAAAPPPVPSPLPADGEDAGFL